MQLPPIYSLTLYQTPKRTELARKQFLEKGLEVTFFYGIHAPTFGLVTTKAIAPDKDPSDSRIIVPGQVGCFLSHYMLWQALETFTTHDEVLIIEDDALFCENFKDKFAEMYSKLPKDWQFLYVGHRDEAPNSEKELRVESTKYQHCTHGYLIKRETLKLLLQTNQECRCHVDIQIGENTLPLLKVYVVLPALIDQLSCISWKSCAGTFGVPSHTDPFGD